MGPNRTHEDISMKCDGQPASFYIFCYVATIKKQHIHLHDRLGYGTTLTSLIKALVVFKQPGGGGSARQDKVIPPPGLLCSLFVVLTQISHQDVALVLVVWVKAVIGAHGWDGVVLLLHVRL